LPWLSPFTVVLFIMHPVTANVRFGSKADMYNALADVR
jgi:hypothetical protein